MTSQYRDRELKEAEEELKAARKRFDNAKTKKAACLADEDLQFWGSRVANLTQVL